MKWIEIGMQQQADFATVGEFLQWASEYFVQHELHYGHGTDNAWDEAVMLVLYVLRLPADCDESVLQQELTVEQRHELHELAQQRVVQQIPVPYLTHEAWFAGERYYVTPDVLIPRSPFAELIIYDFEPWITHEPRRILDLCTGSGCLAILCAKTFPNVMVDAVDISAAALAVAERNVELHECQEQVRLICSDLFASLSTDQRYDIIISNPPYVGMEEMAALPVEYSHEPELALVSADDGLEITLQILRQAAEYLQDTGLLFVEVGNSADILRERLPLVPFTWLEFESGGEGVFMLTAQQLKQFF